MGTLNLCIKTSKDTSSFKQASQDQENLNRIINLISGVAIGAVQATIDVQSSSDNPVAASGTLTLTSAIATDAVTIGKTTLTASSTPANENQWEIDGASDTLDAASLAAAINAHSALSLIVTATSAAEVVTITAKQKGVLGNYIALSSADATIVASATYLASGAGGSTNAAVSIAR